MLGSGTGRTLAVALAVSLVCSLAVASVTVLLRPLQSANELLARQRNILEAAGLLTDTRPLEEQFSQIDVQLVSLADGRYVEGVDASVFDPVAAARDPELGLDIAPELDIAALGRRSKFGPVYLVRRGGRIKYFILPVRGQGLWATMYGYIALERDANTVAGLSFFQHGETPGLGANIDDPDWLELWRGKLVYADGKPAIEVIRGKVALADSVTRASPGAGDPAYQVDGLSGATLTGRGVTNMLKYWLGPDGYGPYLQRIWEEERR